MEKEQALAASEAASEPFELFAAWLKDAAASEPNDPNAAALATASPDGEPSVRMVLVKRSDARGSWFFSNAESQKCGELAANPRAALCLHWKSLRRQVRIAGRVSLLSSAKPTARAQSNQCSKARPGLAPRARLAGLLLCLIVPPHTKYMRAHFPARRLCSIVIATALLPVSALAAPVFGYKVLARLPHATTSYTEGFFYLNGLFYEGTGLKGHSAVLVTQPETGRVVREVDLPPQYFGEGIVNRGPDLLEWTWQSHTGFVRRLPSLEPVGSFHYSGEGWGMTRTNKELITSDGTATLRFRDPATFAETRHIDVHDGAKPVDQLNELEYVKGVIYANVWHSDRIARISPQDGRVLSWVDLTGILPDVERLDPEAVLNGIAYDAHRDRLFVTGKEWPTIFEIKVVPKR